MMAGNNNDSKNNLQHQRPHRGSKKRISTCRRLCSVFNYPYALAIFYMLFCQGSLVDSFVLNKPYRSHSCSIDRLGFYSAGTRRICKQLPISSRKKGDSSGDKEQDASSGTKVDAGGPLHHAVAKFTARPGTYLIIPVIAALVGWFTNYLAVQMIFYPIKFRGIPLWRRDEIPLGLIGWQGIVPCKTKPMTEAMVTMVTTQLLTVKEAFGRLDPRQVAKLLEPEVPKLAEEVLHDIVPRKWMVGIPGAIVRGFPSKTRFILKHFNMKFLENLTKGMQKNIDSIFDINNCVVDQMLQDRTKLGQLFFRCGQKELDFLVNSGLWFGFLLGIIQMIVALFWDNPWTLSIGGMIVGLATNWLALKWIFEPVNPTKIGPFILQGQFLRRQTEVAKEFSDFFANRILTSEQIWQSMFNDPTTYPAFSNLFSEHFGKFVNRIGGGLRLRPEPETLQLATRKALEKLPGHVHVLHSYVDKTLGLQETLRVKMELMTSSQFERVLHPIFEEDELTLILAGAALGFAAGLIQQGIETGAITFPPIMRIITKSSIMLSHRLTTWTVQFLALIHGKFGDKLPEKLQRRIVSLQKKMEERKKKLQTKTKNNGNTPLSESDQKDAKNDEDAPDQV